MKARYISLFGNLKHWRDIVSGKNQLMNQLFIDLSDGHICFHFFYI